MVETAWIGLGNAGTAKLYINAEIVSVPLISNFCLYKHIRYDTHLLTN